jgi:hypothetical protein
MTTKTKTETVAQSTPLATMRAVELHRALSDASIFASHNETIPGGVCMVRIEFTGVQHTMLAVATDRFRLGVSRVVLDGKPDSLTESFGSDATFNLALRDVSALIRLAKTLKRDEYTRVVWMTQSATNAHTVTFKFSDGAALDVTPSDAEFPKWRQLFPDSGTQHPRAATAFTADYLASFGKVDSGFGARIVMYSHDDAHGYDREKQKSQKPTTFTIGENFVGLLMPVKIEDGPDGNNGSSKRVWHKPEWIA